MAAKARRLGAVEDETVDASGVRAKSAKQFKVRVHGACRRTRSPKSAP